MSGVECFMLGGGVGFALGVLCRPLRWFRRQNLKLARDYRDNWSDRQW